MKIDTTKTPAWDLTLTIRGVDVPTLSPLTAADRSIVNLGERRRGVAVRLWRWLFGEPRRVVADDHETAQLRHTVAAFTAPEFRRLLGSLTGGELLAVLGAYVGAQQAWYAQIERAARAQAEAIWAARTGGGAAGGDNEPEPVAPGVKRYRVPPTPLVPGQLPDWAREMFDGGVKR